MLKGRKPRTAAQPDALDSLDLDLDEGETKQDSFGGGFGGAPGMPDFNGAAPSEEQIEKAMQQMDNLLDSNFVDEYFSDDEKLEKARLNMLENLDQYGKFFYFNDNLGFSYHVLYRLQHVTIKFLMIMKIIVIFHHLIFCQYFTIINVF